MCDALATFFVLFCLAYTGCGLGVTTCEYFWPTKPCKACEDRYEAALRRALGEE